MIDFSRIENRVVLLDRERMIFRYTAAGRIDNDGAGGNRENDKFHQSATSYRYRDGSSLNPYDVPFAVCPISLVKAVKPAVLGSRCIIEYQGRKIEAFIGDLGGRDPKTNRERLGEMSVRAAELLGINPDPNRGGVDDGVTYTVFIGQPSKSIDGVVYTPRMWNGK